MTIVDFIPKGEENAISRQQLTIMCDCAGLIPDDCKDKDRYMRSLINKARESAAIISRPEGGYYQPLVKDGPALKRYIDCEKSRAIACFKAVKFATWYYEDLQRGLIKDLEGEKENG